jgi:hypothetical protein
MPNGLEKVSGISNSPGLPRTSSESPKIPWSPTRGAWTTTVTRSRPPALTSPELGVISTES